MRETQKTEPVGERETERLAFLAAVEGRKIVGVDLDGTDYGDGSQSTDRATLTLDDGTVIEFEGFWCNDTTADLGWEIHKDGKTIA